MPPKPEALAGPENRLLRRRLVRDGRAMQGGQGVAPFAAVFHAAQLANWNQQMMNTIIVAPRGAGREMRAPADPPPAHAAGDAAGSSLFHSLDTVGAVGAATTGSAPVGAPSRRTGDTGLDAFAGSAQETAGAMSQVGSRACIVDDMDDARQPRLLALGPGSSAYSGQPDADLACVTVEPHGAAPEPPKKQRRLLPGGSPGPDPPNTLRRTLSPRLGQTSALWSRVNKNTGGLLDEALDLFTV